MAGPHETSINGVAWPGKVFSCVPRGVLRAADASKQRLLLDDIIDSSMRSLGEHMMRAAAEAFGPDVADRMRDEAIEDSGVDAGADFLPESCASKEMGEWFGRAMG